MARLRLRVDLAPGHSLGPGKVGLLEGIAETGSISAAARRLGMSYRRAWMLLDALGQTFAEPLVETSVGGREGGGARLTPFGAEIVSRFRAMEKEAEAALSPHLAAFARARRD